MLFYFFYAAMALLAIAGSLLMKDINRRTPYQEPSVAERLYPLDTSMLE